MARLIVLWLLSERELTGYEIKKALTDDGMSFWYGLEAGSIYSVLKTLTKHGYATVVGTEKPGNRPARTRYKISSDGRMLYRSLLVEALATPLPPMGPIDIALAARGDLRPAAVSEALARRTTALQELEAEMLVHGRACPSAAVVDRNLALVTAERSWLTELDERTVT